MPTGSGCGGSWSSLCVTQVTSWGILYYAFPVLSGRISAATGWSPPALTAAFSAGLVVSAVAGVGVGRWIDRHGPRGVMTLGSVVAVLAVVAIAVAPTSAGLRGRVAGRRRGDGRGVVSAGVRRADPLVRATRVGALTVLTLAGGFASTIFAPITAALADRLDWRGVYLVLAAVLAVVTIPAHAVGLRRPWPPVAETVPAAQRPAHILTSRPVRRAGGRAGPGGVRLPRRGRQPRPAAHRTRHRHRRRGDHPRPGRSRAGARPARLRAAAPSSATSGPARSPCCSGWPSPRSWSRS